MKPTILTYILNVVASVALVLVTGAAAYSSPTLNIEVSQRGVFEKLDHDHSEQDASSHECHGQVSCEIQTAIPLLRRIGSKFSNTEVFVMSLSKDRSIFAQHPEPPPPES